METRIEVIKALPEVQEIEQSTSSFLNMVLALKVTDADSFKLANSLFLDADSRIKAIDKKLDPKRALAYEAYQGWLKLIKELKDPYLKGKAHLDGQMTPWKQEQDRIRREEEERLRQKEIKEEMERRKKAEEQRLAEAAALEEAGAKEEANQVLAEAMQEMETPFMVNPSLPTTPKIELEGIASKTYWNAEVFDLMALVKAIAKGEQPLIYVEASMSPLNEQAKRLQENMKIPGVRAKSRSSMSATGR